MLNHTHTFITTICLESNGKIRRKAHGFDQALVLLTKPSRGPSVKSKLTLGSFSTPQFVFLLAVETIQSDLQLHLLNCTQRCED